MASVRSRRPRLGLPASNPDRAMPLMAHLLELRTRLVRAALGLALTTGLSFAFSQQLLDIFLAIVPKDVHIVIQAIKVTETFTTYFRVALTAGLIAAMPILIYELLAFLSPGLKANERRWVLLGLPFVILFFVAGVVFGYFVL